jgi:hypothetical protein
MTTLKPDAFEEVSQFTWHDLTATKSFPLVADLPQARGGERASGNRGRGGCAFSQYA